MRAGLLLAFLAPAALACELPGGAAQQVKSAATTVVYRTPALKLGEHFAVEFAVCPAPESVRVDAWMPDHRHGMNYKASVNGKGGGRYRAEGLMFHMPGRWELVFELRGAGAPTRLTQSLQVD